MREKLFVVLALFLASSSVQASSRQDSEARFWADVKVLMQECAVQPYSVDHTGKKVYGALENVCNEIEVFETSAKFVLNGRLYYAFLTESRFADEGDLNDLVVRDSRGEIVATRTNIPAFGDILLALAGSDEGLRHRYDSNLR